MDMERAIMMSLGGGETPPEQPPAAPGAQFGLGSDNPLAELLARAQGMGSTGVSASSGAGVGGSMGGGGMSEEAQITAAVMASGEDALERALMLSMAEAGGEYEVPPSRPSTAARRADSGGSGVGATAAGGDDPGGLAGGAEAAEAELRRALGLSVLGGGALGAGEAAAAALGLTVDTPPATAPAVAAATGGGGAAAGRGMHADEAEDLRRALAASLGEQQLASAEGGGLGGGGGGLAAELLRAGMAAGRPSPGTQARRAAEAEHRRHERWEQDFAYEEGLRQVRSTCAVCTSRSRGRRSRRVCCVAEECGGGVWRGRWVLIA
eukprot:COSAG01_NODE_2178_length_8215_cov_128.540414_7_plen_323_part_00